MIAKDKVVFPIPLIMLIKVLFVYRKGHIQARVIMKSPAIELSNKKIPIHFPKASKATQQILPRKIQE